jgi:hypothetical protein
MVCLGNICSVSLKMYSCFQNYLKKLFSRPNWYHIKCPRHFYSYQNKIDISQQKGRQFDSNDLVSLTSHDDNHYDDVIALAQTSLNKSKKQYFIQTFFLDETSIPSHGMSNGFEMVYNIC